MRARSRAALQSTFALAALAAMVVVAATAPATAVAPAPSAAVSDGGTPALGDEGSTFDGRSTGVAATQSETPPREGTSFIVSLQPNGNARWTVMTRFELDNESDRAAFEDLARRYERGDTDVGFDIETFRRANRAANATVNRSMTIRSVERTTAVVPGENGTATGRLMLNFTWTAFARTDDGRLRFGSAFNTTDGTWLPGLAADQTLEIRPPRGYGVFTATTTPRAGILRWEGPTTFEPGDVAAVYERNGGPTPTPTPATPGSPTPTPTTNTTTSPGNPTLPGTLVFVGGIGGLLLLGAVLLVLRRQRGDQDGTGGPAADDGGDGGAATADTGDSAGPDPADGTAATGAADGGDDDEHEPEEEEETELLSDEERVERLLERNGGRMKQANIVSETGWSNAKVSQLLSSMDEADRIDKLRIGRENLISLPDEDVTDIDEE